MLGYSRAVLSASTIDWAAVREWLIAAGTVGATGAAVWIGVLQPRRRRPALSLHFDPTDPRDAQVAGIVFIQPGQPGSEFNTRGAFARLRVANAAGRETADDVEVLVEAVRLTDPGSQPTFEAESLGDLPLPASNSEPTTTRLSIPPGIERHFDLAHVRKREVAEGDRDVILEVFPRPADLRWRVDADRFEVDVVVAASNADARRYTVGVEFDGRWPEDEAEAFAHFRVGPPKRR